MIDSLVLFYGSNQNIISVLFMLAPVGALMLRHRRRRLGGRDLITAGTFGAVLHLGLLMLLSASASEEVAATINFPKEVAILGGIAVVYACRGLRDLWQIQFKDDNNGN